MTEAERGAASPELVTTSGIAEMAGVSRPAINNWRKRHPDFPLPVAETGLASTYRLDEVIDWLDQHGKSYTAPSLDRVVWNLLNGTRGGATTQAVAELGMVLAGLAAVSDAQAEILETRGIGHRLGTVLRRLREDPRAAGVDPEVLIIDGRDLDRCEQFIWGVAGLLRDHSAAQVFEALLSCWRRAEGRRAGFASASLGSLLVRLASPLEGTVLDPSCGFGDLLLALGTEQGGSSTTELVGRTVARDAWRIASLRMLAHGISADLRVADVLYEDSDRGLTASAVVTSPPFNCTWRPGLWDDPDRWIAGTPNKSDGDLAMIQHVISRLADGGRGFVVTSPSLAFRRGSSAKIRRRLVDAGCVHALVALPAGLFQPSTSIAATVWIVGPPGSSASEVLLIDARDHGRRRGQSVELPRDAVDDVVATYKACTEREDSVSATSWATSVKVSDLDDACELTPQRWLPRLGRRVDLVERTETARREMRAAQSGVSDAIVDEAAVMLNTGAPQVVRVSVRDLIQRDFLTLIRSRRVPKNAVADEGTPLVRSGDLDDDLSVQPGAYIDLEALGADPPVTKPGDVLVVTDGRFRVAVDRSGGSVVAAPVHILRPNGDSMDPLVLAALLGQTAANWRQSAGGGVGHHDLYRFELPIIERAASRQVAQALEALLEQRKQATALVATTDQFIGCLVEGTASGVVTLAATTEKGS